jgi:hypothetical protein
MRAAALFLVPALWAAPPTPESHFGHTMGQDRSTLEWSAVVSYFQKLDAESDRVSVREFGKSTEGRPMIVAYISSPENLRRLESLRQIQKKLADPRITPEAEAQKLIAEGKTVVLITCSIHSTELAATHTAVEYAYRMATGNTPKIRAILDNVILMLAPSINPDGNDIVTNWYRKTLNTPYEGTTPPQLYQKYVGHDNNRDWYIFSQAETRAVVSQLHNQWHPHIVYDVHQQGPFASRMFIPPWLDPLDPNVDPVIAQEANMVGMTMAADLTAAGRKGVVVNAIYDFWTPGRHYQSYHGGMRILSESASVRLASPITVRPEQIGNQALGYSPRERSWNYLEPWLGGEWRLRDIVDEQIIAWDSLLYTAASRREDFVRAFYGINQRAAARRSPYAFVISNQQADPGATKKLLETLDFGAVEVERAAAPFTVGSKLYPAGSFVVRMQQPFSPFAKTLLERQKYPDLRQYPGGPPRRPYDVTAQTLPLLMGVAVDTVDDQFQAQLARTSDFSGLRGGVLPQGWLAASDSEAWRRVNAAWKAGRPVWRDPKNGNFYLGAAQPVGSAAARKPRVGLYKSFIPNMDEGWTRWIFEDFGWDYASVQNPAIRAGDLKAKFDVIVFAEQSASAIQNGYRPGAMPEEYLGGLGAEGAAALKTFVEQGGRLVFINESGEYAIDQLDVKAKNVLKGVSNRDFYCPGSLLNVKLEPGHPLGFGLPAEFTLWMEQSPVYEPEEGKPVLRYSAAPVLASGWLLGERLIAGKPALVEIDRGKGRILLFGFRPQYRAQSYLTLKLFYNALLY